MSEIKIISFENHLRAVAILGVVLLSIICFVSSAKIWIVVVGIVIVFVTLTLYLQSVFLSQIKNMFEFAKSGKYEANYLQNGTDFVGQLYSEINKNFQSQDNQIKKMEAIIAGNYSGKDSSGDADKTSEAVSKLVKFYSDKLTLTLEKLNSLSSGSLQVRDASHALSQGATEQASALQQISASMSEISTQIQSNSDHARTADGLAKDTCSAAVQGKEQVGTTLNAMSDIDVSSKEIAKIIKIIDDIAFQTNLLALNAAVEAARAGHHGKGFAVVAGEVRSLAGRSAKAAHETSGLIESSRKKVENGLALANTSMKAFEEIAARVEKVADLITKIADASNAQAQGVLQVTTGLRQIEGVTQQNTASAEETAAASAGFSSQISEISESLNGSVSKKASSPKDSEIRTRSPVSQVKSRPASTPVRSVDTNKIPQLETKNVDPGWGHTTQEKKHAPTKLENHDQITTVRPEEIIALDDNEYGKYSSKK